mmetsp:Transcript_100745/g.285561  ORF Transcript_100745/g.285561 Transcript_100745/m.285561 type:complete len:396 (-) Transcript_100745:7-1194(-)
MALLRLQLVEQVTHGLVAVRAPVPQVQLELAEPGPQVLLVVEGPARLLVLQRAAFQEDPLYLVPLQPRPGVHVLQLSVAVLVRPVELDRVEVDARDPDADDVHRVQMVHCDQVRVARSGHHFLLAVGEDRAYHLQGAGVCRVELRPGLGRAQLEGRVRQEAHLLAQRPAADLVELGPLGRAHHLARPAVGDLRHHELLRQEPVPRALLPVGELLPGVHQEEVALVGLLRGDLGAEHVRHSHGFRLALDVRPQLQARLLVLELLPVRRHALAAGLDPPLVGAEVVLAQPLRQGVGVRHVRHRHHLCSPEPGEQRVRVFQRHAAPVLHFLLGVLHWALAEHGLMVPPEGRLRRGAVAAAVLLGPPAAAAGDRRAGARAGVVCPHGCRGRVMPCAERA